MALGACGRVPISCNPPTQYPPNTRHIPECDGPPGNPFYHKCYGPVPDVKLVAGPTEDDPLTVHDIAEIRSHCAVADYTSDRGVKVVLGYGCRP